MHDSHSLIDYKFLINIVFNRMVTSSFKSNFTSFIVALFIASTFVACSDVTGFDDHAESLESQELESTFDKKKGNKNSKNSAETVFSELNYCEEQSFTLWAGQHHDAGNVVIKVEDGTISVTYIATGDWTIQHTHMHIAKDLSGVPTSGNGSPVMGHFTYSQSHDNATFYNKTVSFEEAGLSVGDTFVVVTHAEVSNGSGGETAFGGNLEGPGKRWWFYASGTIQECETTVNRSNIRRIRGSRW